MVLPRNIIKYQRPALLDCNEHPDQNTLIAKSDFGNFLSTHSSASGRLNPLHSYHEAKICHSIWFSRLNSEVDDILDPDFYSHNYGYAVWRTDKLVLVRDSLANLVRLWHFHHKIYRNLSAVHRHSDENLDKQDKILWDYHSNLDSLLISVQHRTCILLLPHDFEYTRWIKGRSHDSCEFDSG